MRIGTGWLGWTEAQVLDTSMDVTVEAYLGRVDMINFMAGREVKSMSQRPQKVSSAEMNAHLFSALFGNK